MFLAANSMRHRKFLDPVSRLLSGCLGQSGACPRFSSNWGFPSVQPQAPFIVALVFKALLVVSVVAHAVAAICSAAPPEPRGYYVLQSGRTDAPISRHLLENPHLQGFVLRRMWAQVNPAPGQYDWSYLDREIARAKQHGKKIQLIMFSGAATPGWVYEAGAKSLTFSDFRKAVVPLRMPVPWDEVMLQKYETFVAAFGSRYNGEPAITLVHAGGPTRFSVEFHLPREVADLPDFKSQKLITAWQRCVRAYAQAFPDKNIALNVSQVFTAADKLAQQVIGTAQPLLGPRLTLQHDALAAKTTARFVTQRLIALYGERGVRIGFEMLSPAKEARFGGPFMRAVDTARGVKAQYLNIYSSDVAEIRAPY